MPYSIRSGSFGALPDGTPATLFTLTNARGHVVALTDYGAAIVGLQVPDRAGKLADVVLGFDDLAGFLSEANPYFGCVVGRVGNRIAKGRFTLDGTEHQLTISSRSMAPSTSSRSTSARITSTAARGVSTSCSGART